MKITPKVLRSLDLKRGHVLAVIELPMGAQTHCELPMMARYLMGCVTESEAVRCQVEAPFGNDEDWKAVDAARRKCNPERCQFRHPEAAVMVEHRHDTYTPVPVVDRPLNFTRCPFGRADH